MTNFSERGKSFEAEYSRNQELAFRITARRNRLFGLWVAAKIGLPEGEERDSYAKAVIAADLQAPGEISFPANLSPFESQPLPEQVPTSEVNLLPSFGVGSASGIDDLDFDDEDFSAPHSRIDCHDDYVLDPILTIQCFEEFLFFTVSQIPHPLIRRSQLLHATARIVVE